VSYAAFSLGCLKDDSAADTLINLISHQNKKIREASAWSLGKVCPKINAKLLPLLDNPNQEVRGRTVFALGKKKAKSAVPKLIEMIKVEKDPGFLNSIAWALGSIGDGRGEDSLINFVKHEDESVRYQAAIALQRIGSKKSLKPLFQARMSERSNKVKKELSEAINRISSR